MRGDHTDGALLTFCLPGVSGGVAGMSELGAIRRCLEQLWQVTSRRTFGRKPLLRTAVRAVHDGEAGAQLLVCAQVGCVIC